MPEIISRKEAKARGLRRYFSGKLCKNGHRDEHYVADSNCVECHRASARAYSAANADKQKMYRDENREKIRAYNRKHYAENPDRREKHLAACRKHSQANRHNAEYRERHNAATRKCRMKNREKYRISSARYMQKVRDLIAVLRVEKPDLLKEFGL